MLLTVIDPERSVAQRRKSAAPKGAVATVGVGEFALLGQSFSLFGYRLLAFEPRIDQAFDQVSGFVQMHRLRWRL